MKILHWANGSFVKYRPSYLSHLPNFLLVLKKESMHVTSNNVRKIPLFEFLKQFEQLLYIFVNTLNLFFIHFDNSGLLYWNDYKFKTKWTWRLILNLDIQERDHPRKCANLKALSRCGISKKTNILSRCLFLKSARMWNVAYFSYDIMKLLYSWFSFFRIFI